MMSLKTHKFARKPFYVDAVRVSENNIEEVAEWCKGEVVNNGTDPIHIRVEVNRPLNERQTQAFVGDWVLFAGTGFKVYMPKAFDRSFEKVKHLSKEQADIAGIKPPHEKSQPPKRRVPPALTQSVLSKELADKINGNSEEEKSEPEIPAAEVAKAQGDVKQPFTVLTEEDRQKEEADRLIAEVEAMKRA
jgi:hypothetical protein